MFNSEKRSKEKQQLDIQLSPSERVRDIIYNNSQHIKKRKYFISSTHLIYFIVFIGIHGLLASTVISGENCLGIIAFIPIIIPAYFFNIFLSSFIDNNKWNYELGVISVILSVILFVFIYYYISYAIASLEKRKK